MRKRIVLLAALFICCAIQLNVNANHETNVDNVTNREYKSYTDVDGGALKTDTGHTSTVTNSTFTENKASSSGGAIYNEGNMTVKSSSFSSNTAEKNVEQDGGGGAIYNDGDITVDGSSFLNNTAGKSDPAWDEHGHGGAVYNKKNAEITNSTFTGNHAKYGGAIYNENESSQMTVGGKFTDNTAQAGGAINNRGTLTVKSGSSFENNSVSGFDGGAIDNEGGTLNIEDNVIFKNNLALEEGEKRGGAIFSESLDGPNSQVHIGSDVIFEANKALEGGAIGIFKNNTVSIQDNAVFKGNMASTNGGAISMFTIDSPDLSASEFVIGNNALFEGNIAGFDSEQYRPEYGSAFGGAISLTDSMEDEGRYSSFKIGDNAVFRNNKASLDSSVYGFGGAIYNAAKKTTIGEHALFQGNTATYAGGAICNYTGSNLTLGDYAVFDSNSSDSVGGAIYYYNNAENKLQKAQFINNKAGSMGGAIYNGDGHLNITDTVFNDNSVSSATDAVVYGGALYNESNAAITNSLFENNSADGSGGAIYNIEDTQNEIASNLTIDNTQFTKNKAFSGGAIASYGKNEIKITKSTFKDNSAIKENDINGQGGAIWMDVSSGNNLDIDSSIFENNTSGGEGGAIWAGNKTDIKNSLFIENSSGNKKIKSDNNNDGGGAIFVSGSSETTIEKSDFINNYSSSVGGAIATQTSSSENNLTVTGSTFSGNIAEDNGGAIASYKKAAITDTSFVNNKAGGRGGAIWANSDITVEAKESDVVFYGNSAEDGGDIYMDKLSSSNKVGSLNLQASENKNITIADGISGADTYEVTLNGAGKVTFNSEIKNADMKVTAGTLHLAEGSSLGEGTTVNVTNATLDSQDGKINDYGEKVKIGSGSKIKFDISSAAKTTDKFSKADDLSGEVKIEDFNFLPDTTVSNGSMTSDEIRESLGLGEAVVLELPEKSLTTLTPLRYVNVRSGADGISYTPTGNTFRDFNPAVTVAPVAAQLGGYLTQLDSYDEAFRNMDMYMIMPKSMRQAMKYKNKYAQAGSDLNYIYDKSSTPYESTALWARPYATFENVRLKNGPKVSNVGWGTYLGGDSELFDLKNGWEGMWSLYAGYNGSHQAYNGVSIYQNGGTLGLTGTLYKNNFFTGLTANVGANSAEASTGYGEDSFGLFRTGVASKTGYNLEFADGKFIIQPSWLMSYSFVNTEDYTTSNGIRVDSNPLNVMHLEPGLKFIGNVGKGWQPYTGLSIVWNLFDKTDFIASDATLPELSVKPFFRYGVGLRKLCGERFVGYGQTYFTSGGRNGVGLQFGGRWSI